MTTSARSKICRRWSAVPESCRDTQSIVEALIAEGDLDAAWEAADAGRCTASAWRRLAEASVETHPDRAAEVLRAQLDAVGAGTRLTMLLRYGGVLWTGGVLERVLDEQVRRGSEALLALVSAEPMR